ncbi:hypothetical protein FHS01_001089 [Longimicrobium terrae]|nr:toprim domain-containing protein [Longimicrobium terrae]MBB4635079.1 hypothetical protein [Longimicrobium terrae]
MPDLTGAALLAASGYPFLPVRVRYQPARAWHPLRDGREAARYLYTGAEGEPRFECIRQHLPADHSAAPDKAFLWRHLDADGRWAWGLPDGPTVPYRLPRVQSAALRGGRVYVVEGEKDVESLEGLGLTATTSPLGAMQWTKGHAEFLRGAEVIVIPDADRTGRIHAARVLHSLRGRARSAALLLLPLADGEDVSDWIARGHGGAELERLADAAARDLTPAEVAAALGLPAGVDPLSTRPESLNALLAGGDVKPAAVPHPAFRRSITAMQRLGVVPGAPAAAPGLPDAHPTWRAVRDAVRATGAETAALLQDASRLESAAYELGLFARLLRACGAGEPPRPADADSPADGFVTAPSVRVVRTRWDWDAFLADSARAAPQEAETAWVLLLAASGPVQIRRLHPLPALLLEACAWPLAAADIVAAVAEQVDAPLDQLAPVVAAQIAELRASGLLLPAAATAADETVDEMQRLLSGDEAPAMAPRGLAGLMARAIRPAREHAAAALEAADGAHAIHGLDVSVGLLEQLLGAARLRHAFAAELDGYWSAPDARARVASLTHVLDVLAGALGAGMFARSPYVIS